jgi:hypothetical protein
MYINVSGLGRKDSRMNPWNKYAADFVRFKFALKLFRSLKVQNNFHGNNRGRIFRYICIFTIHIGQSVLPGYNFPHLQRDPTIPNISCYFTFSSADCKYSDSCSSLIPFSRPALWHPHICMTSKEFNPNQNKPIQKKPKIFLTADCSKWSEESKFKKRTYANFRIF